MEEYCVRQKKDLSLMNEKELLEHKRKQRQKANATYYQKKKQYEVYITNTHNEMVDLLNDDRYDGEDKDLILECIQICKEELKQS